MFWRDPSTKMDYVYRGNKLQVDMSFDNVLTALEVLEHDRFTIEQKLDTLFEVFTDAEVWEHFPLEYRMDFVVRMLKDLLEIDLTRQTEGDENVPLFDWVEDAGRIHSSFLFDYGMDLREQQGKMDWTTFKELFFNLSDDCQMGQALHYRQCPVPKQDKYNADEVTRVKAQKERYALKNERYAEKVRKVREREILARMEAHKRKVKGG